MRTAALVLAALVLAACGGPGAGSPAGAGPARRTRNAGDGRPAVAVVSRAGDAQGAIAVAVTTEGIAPERGAVPAVALAALVEARLAQPAQKTGGVTTSSGWGGFRLRTLAESAASAGPFVEAVRDAMLAPVAADDAALALVRRRVQALAQRPLPDRALVDAARCTGEAFGMGGDAPPDATELEAWRRAAFGTGRVAFASAGDEALATAVTDALARGAAWPAAAPVPPSPWPAPDAPAAVYEASGEIPPGAARVVVTARAASPDRVVGAAPALGRARGPLASRLAALAAPARVTSVVATAHGDGGCLAATLDLSARDLASDGPARIATAAALARQEISVELADAADGFGVAEDLAAGAPDPRDAAERAAWWTLAGRRAEAADSARLAITVGVATPRDAPAATAVPADDIRAELDRATIAWHAPVVEARTRVERGQGEAWILLASTCGTLPEGTGDAGTGAAVSAAAALQASDVEDDARVEPFVAADGVGVLAHGPPRDGESPSAHARRLADLAARAFAADPLEPARVQLARGSLLARARDVDARALAAAASGLVPGHPSWLLPGGTGFGLASTSDDDVETRAASMRAGPLRIAILANADEAQAEAAVRAADRWIARRPGEARACPVAPAVKPRPGTYAVEVPAGAHSEALLAAVLPAGDEAARAAAIWTAAALDGEAGLLARSLVPSGDRTRPLSVASSARVIGPRGSALVVRVVPPDDASLDPAVAQVRALLDRLRQGGLREEDRARATAALGQEALTAALDPRERLVSLWRGESSPQPPSLDALHQFAGAVLHDEALVIVAARPSRSPATRPRPRGH